MLGLWSYDGWLRDLERVMREASPGELALMLVPLSLGAGVGEELVCRGYLQTRLAERWGRWWGVALEALAFGVLHFDPAHSLLAFFMGLFLGWSVERADSIRPAMLAHAFNNVVAFMLMREVDRNVSWPDWAYLAVLGAFAAVLAVCVRVLRGPGAAVAPEPGASAAVGT